MAVGSALPLPLHDFIPSPIDHACLFVFLLLCFFGVYYPMLNNRKSCLAALPFASRNSNIYSKITAQLRARPCVGVMALLH